MRTTLTETDLSEEILILGEKFNVHHESGEIQLLHPRWSLSGTGNNISNALINLFEEAEEVYQVYNTIPSAELSAEATEKLNFLKKLEENG